MSESKNSPVDAEQHHSGFQAIQPITTSLFNVEKDILIRHSHRMFDSDKEVYEKALTLPFVQTASMNVRASREYIKHLLLRFDEIEKKRADKEPLLNCGSVKAQRLAENISSETKMMVRSQGHLGTFAVVTIGKVSYDPRDFSLADGGHRSLDWLRGTEDEFVDIVFNVYYIESQEKAPILMRAVGRTIRHSTQEQLYQQFVAGDTIAHKLVFYFPKVDDKTGRPIILKSQKTPSVYPVTGTTILGAIFISKYKASGSFHPVTSLGQFNPIDIDYYIGFYRSLMDIINENKIEDFDNVKTALNNHIIHGLVFSYYKIMKEEKYTEYKINTEIARLMKNIASDKTGFINSHGDKRRFKRATLQHTAMIGDFAILATATDKAERMSPEWAMRAEEMTSKLNLQVSRSPKRTDRLGQEINEIWHRTEEIVTE